MGKWRYACQKWARYLQCIKGSPLRCQWHVSDNWQRRKKKKKVRNVSDVNKSAEACQMVSSVPADCWRLVTVPLPTSQKYSADWSGDFNFKVNLANTSPIINKRAMIAHLSHFPHNWILHLCFFGSNLWPSRWEIYKIAVVKNIRRI